MDATPALLGLIAAVAFTDCVAGQVQVRPRPPMRVGGALLAPPRSDEDPGRRVLMLESPNIDRFLHRAQDFLAREDFQGAIKIIQDIVEGRTLEDPAAAVAPEGAGDSGAGDSGAGDGTGDAPEPVDDPVWAEWAESAANAVFSDDERLYRPVQRLCHELLASMPAEGIAMYRSLFDVTAQRQLEQARTTRDFEDVYTRWFMTSAAARAMSAAGDALMDQGRHRAAIQTYRLLLDVYPQQERARAGVSDDYVLFRIALCFRLLGDPSMAGDLLDAMAAERPGASIRLMGDLHGLAGLSASEMFGAPPRTAARLDDSAIRAFRSPGETVVPLWEHRFEEAHPYRGSKANQQRTRVFVTGGSAMSSTPKHSAFVPGTSVRFVEGRVAFLDHFRLSIHDRLSGRMEQQGSGPLTMPRPKQNTPRTRIPAYDFATLRVSSDDRRFYVIVGPTSRNPSGMKPVLQNHLEALSRDDLSTVWITDRNADAFKELTFLATPTVFGSRLLAPVVQRGTYGLLCLDANDGDVVFHVHIHREGTNMARPPAAPVVVESGIAYVLSNAGALASVDAYTGTLRWIRRYERTHPFRSDNRRRTRQPRRVNPFGGNFFREEELWGYAPSEIVALDGLIAFAPSDGRVLHCVDGASGEPVWMVDWMDPYTYVVGHDGEHAYLGGPDYVICVGLQTGVRLWREDLPSYSGSNRWRGRGTVHDGRLLMPGNRQLLIRELRDPVAGGGWHAVDLPAFSYGQEPLNGNFNVHFDGAYFAAVYEGGIEMYSTAETLLAIADASEDLLERSVFQAQAGDLMTAVATLEAIDVGAAAPAVVETVSRRILSLSSELALAMAVRGARDEALDLLDRCRTRIRGVRHLQRWHLARIEVFQALGDLEAVEDEQETLYASMGRRG